MGDPLAAGAPGDQLLAHELAHVVQAPSAAPPAPTAAAAPTDIRIAPPRPQTQTIGVRAAGPEAPSAAAPKTS